ncbi:MAG: PIG-L deacetylase family protein [Oscillochloridaceae bacterium umkhey_bin13]
MAFHYTSLEQLVAPYGQIVLSPHLDDAALSLGGMLASQAACGRPTLVLNVCTGRPDLTVPLSPFAAAMHARWGLDAHEVLVRRLAEDEAAFEILGIDSYQLDQLDAIYRLPTAYYDNPTLFGAVDPADPLQTSLLAHLQQLHARYPQAVIYAPLAVGKHVDHQIAYAAAKALAAQGASVAFYEDFPYVAEAGALEARLEDLGGPARFTAVPTPFEPSALARKIAAIEAYASQLGTLFGDAATMRTAVTAQASRHATTPDTYLERIWIAQ